MKHLAYRVTLGLHPGEHCEQSVLLQFDSDVWVA